ncbi:DUF3427 domain-containing protein [Noviluteimonas dokdonensis]|uniref:DUF3427 domain-containing protein n=1 Tax=Noviluteimonas dokdonensis TaxID=414050 RepID=UPI00055ECE14|nr:DUF3427 domain-containing protein [Lysobacter dokdonensis]
MKGEAIALEPFRLGATYTREDIAQEGGVAPINPRSGGITEYSNAVLFFVTLEKEEPYLDTFDGTYFQWQSQLQQHQGSPVILRIRDEALPVHLFARIRAKTDGRTHPFVYCGELAFLAMQGENPVTVMFQSLHFDLKSKSDLLRAIYAWRSNLPPSALDRARRDEIEGRVSKGQGRLLDAALRKKIELLGMEAAKGHYVSLKYVVRDTSANHPYDLECRRGSELRRVEVKATQGDASEVYVTSGEVLCARMPGVSTDLFILHGVRVHKENGKELSVIGGQVRIVENWHPRNEDLTATQYRYRVSK